MVQLRKLFAVAAIGTLAMTQTASAAIEKFGPFDASGGSVMAGDGSGFGYSYAKEGKTYVVMAGKTYGPYDSVNDASFDFKNSKSGFGFIATKQGKQYVNVKGTEYGGYDSVTELKFGTGGGATFQYSKDGNSYVNINSKAYGPYSTIRKIVFSNDGKSFSFEASKTNKEAGKEYWYANANGKEYGESYDQIMDTRVAQDGVKYAYAYRKGTEYFVVVNGKEYGPFDQYQEGDLKFAQDGDGHSFKYSVQNKYSGKTSYYANVHGTVYGPYAYVEEIKMSYDRKRFGFKYSTEDGGQFVRVGSNNPYGYSSISNFDFSEDGNHFSIIANTASGTVVNLDGKGYGPYDNKYAQFSFIGGADKYDVGFLYSDSSAGVGYASVKGKDYGPYSLISNVTALNGKAAFSYTKDGKDYVFVDERVYGPYDPRETSNLILSPAEGLFAFQYKTNDKRYINVNGVPYGPYDQLDAFKFSMDGKRYAYRHSSGEAWYANVNGTTYGPYDQLDYLVFSEEGQGYNFRYEKDGKRYVNLNGQIIGPYESFMDLILREGGAKGSAFTSKEKDLFRITANGRSFGPYEELKDVVLPANGGGFAFSYRKGQADWYANANGTNHGPCSQMGPVSMSDDGRAYVVRCMSKESKWTVFVNRLSESERKFEELRASIQKVVKPKLRAMSKQQLNALYVKVGQMLAKYQKKKKDAKTSKLIDQLTILLDILKEERQTR